MKRGIAFVLVLAIAPVAGGQAVQGGMAQPEATESAQVTRDAYFVGTFVDWHGTPASFFVDAKTNLLIGPFDHFVATATHGTPTPGAEPAPRVDIGTRGVLTSLQTVPTERVRGRTRPRDTRPVPTVQRLGADPDTAADGAFVAFAPTGAALSIDELVAKQADPLLLGFLGAKTKAKIWALTDGVDQRRALRGLLLGGHVALARAFVREVLWSAPRTSQNDVLAAFGLLLDGLPGMVAAPPCDASKATCHPLYAVIPAARAWLAHQPAEAERLLRDVAKLPYGIPLPHRCSGMMECPREPVIPSFVRGDFLGRDYAEILAARAPELTALMERLYGEHMLRQRH